MSHIKSTIYIIIVLVILTGCSTSGVNNFQSTTSSALVQGSDSWIGNLCIAENGIFYFTRGTSLLRYYDYETGKEQILCDQASCRHMDEDCGAWFGNYDRIYGYAYYQGKVYLMVHDFNGDAVELISMDIGGRNRKTVAYIPSEKNSLTLNRVNSTYYAEDHAWLELEYIKILSSGNNTTNESYRQLVTINLQSGKVVELTEFSDEWTEVEYLPISDGYALFSTCFYSVPPLTEEAYYAQNGEDNDYIKYLDDFSHQANKYGIVYAYSVEDQNISTIWEGPLDKVYTEDGSLKYMRFPNIYAGIYHEQVVYYPWPDNHTDYVHMYNIKTGDDIHVLTIENGGLLARYMGSAAGYIYQGRYIYYLLFEGVQEDCIIHRYDLETGEDMELFRDVWNVTFRILSDTSDKLIGTMNYGQDVYWIYKTDYEKGNLKAAKKIFTGWMGG